MSRLYGHIAGHFWAFIITILLLPGQAASAQAEVKFNAATALVLVPNFGVELHLAPGYTAQLDVLGSFWDSVGEDRDPYHINETFVEARKYSQENNQGWFAGAHVGFGMFTIQKVNAFVIYDQYQDPSTYPDNNGAYHSGRAGFYGITIGKKYNFNSRWGVEFFIGGGLVQSNVKGYSNGVLVTPVNDTREFNRSGEWVLYRGGLMLTYRLFNLNAAQ